MARTLAALPEGTRITDYISLGVISKTFPMDKVKEILQRMDKSSQRQRDLPAHVMVYYVIALALYMQVSYREVLRCLLEGLQWLQEPGKKVRVAGKSGISQARTRLGYGPVMALHDDVVKPIATKKTKGAWYRRWRLASLDGSTMDVADTEANVRQFKRPGASRGKSAYPKVRFVCLVENGTHVLFGTRMAGYDIGEVTLAKQVIVNLGPDMVCLADRNFFGFELWEQARRTGAELLWRVKEYLNLPCLKRLDDGSYLSKIYPSKKDRRHDTNGVAVRVIEYKLEGIEGAEPIYRLLTSLLDPRKAPAHELAVLYHERWEIETALDELKTHLRGCRIILRSKMPDLVTQEFFGLMMAHFAIRGLMHEAALKQDVDPDRLCYVHAVRVIRRKLPHFVALPPSAEESVAQDGS
jgi:hypothetical protein